MAAADRYTHAIYSSWRIEGTPHAAGAVTENMRTDHRRRDIAVAEQLLHGPNIMALLQKVGRKRVPERVARHPPRDPGLGTGAVDGALHNRLVQMIAPLFSLAVPPSPRRRKDPLPLPFCRR